MTTNARALFAVMAVLGLCSVSAVASADQGCEAVTLVDFFKSVVQPGAVCLYSPERDLYECSKGSTSYDLTVEVLQPGDGLGRAVRSDGFTVAFSCSCTRLCGFEDPNLFDQK